MSRLWFSMAMALVMLALEAWAPPATAATSPRSRRVVLLETPAALERALRTALMPWGMHVARSQARARPRPPKSPAQARSLARRLRADALVWLAPALQRHELWLYDGANGTLTNRSVPAPPFDETRAAALALSVKTELRKGTLADATVLSDIAAKSMVPAGKEALLAMPKPVAGVAREAEPRHETAPRNEAAPRHEAEPIEAKPSSGAAPSNAEASTNAGEPSTEPADDALDAEPPPPWPRPPAPAASPEADTGSWRQYVPYDAPRWKLVLHGAARLGATTLGGSEGRYAVEARWAPWADPEAVATLWFAARVDMGLPRPVKTETFTGEYSEVGTGLGLGVGVRLNRWFEVGMQAGAGLRRATLSGTLTRDSTAGERARIGLDLHLRPEMELSLGTLGVLLQPALGISPRRQRYQADEVEVFETQAIWWQLGAGVRVALD